MEQTLPQHEGGWPEHMQHGGMAVSDSAVFHVGHGHADAGAMGREDGGDAKDTRPERCAVGSCEWGLALGTGTPRRWVVSTW